MFDKNQIREHMEIIGADGVHVGTVDHLDDSGERIKLTKHDSPQTQGGKRPAAPLRHRRKCGEHV